MKHKIVFTVILFIFLSSCKNYYNEMIDWTSSIPKGTSIDSVKIIQPDFIEIDWNNAVITDSETRYIITKIKNNNDPLKMENYLSFENNKYQGRFANK